MPNDVIVQKLLKGILQGAEIMLHPYFVKEFHNRWYMIGLNSSYEKIRTYALDRIKDVSLCYEDYNENNLLDPCYGRMICSSFIPNRL